MPSMLTKPFKSWSPCQQHLPLVFKGGTRLLPISVQSGNRFTRFTAHLEACCYHWALTPQAARPSGNRRPAAPAETQLRRAAGRSRWRGGPTCQDASWRPGGGMRDAPLRRPPRCRCRASRVATPQVPVPTPAADEATSAAITHANTTATQAQLQTPGAHRRFEMVG